MSLLSTDTRILGNIPDHVASYHCTIKPGCPMSISTLNNTPVECILTKDEMYKWISELYPDIKNFAIAIDSICRGTTREFLITVSYKSEHINKWIRLVDFTLIIHGHQELWDGIFIRNWALINEPWLYQAIPGSGSVICDRICSYIWPVKID